MNETFLMMTGLVLFQMWTAHVQHRSFVNLNESWLRSEKLWADLDSERVKSADVLIAIGTRALEERRAWMKRAVKAERRLAHHRGGHKEARNGMHRAVRTLDIAADERRALFRGSPKVTARDVRDDIEVAAENRAYAHAKGHGVP